MSGAKTHGSQWEHDPGVSGESPQETAEFLWLKWWGPPEMGIPIWSMNLNLDFAGSNPKVQIHGNPTSDIEFSLSATSPFWELKVRPKLPEILWSGVPGSQNHQVPWFKGLSGSCARADRIHKGVAPSGHGFLQCPCRFAIFFRDPVKHSEKNNYIPYIYIHVYIYI